MAKRRANHEGTIRQRKNGLWEAIVTIGRDPMTGKLKRVSFYAPTQKEVIAKAAKARADLTRGTFVAPEKLHIRRMAGHMAQGLQVIHDTAIDAEWLCEDCE